MGDGGGGGSAPDDALLQKPETLVETTSGPCARQLPCMFSDS